MNPDCAVDSKHRFACPTPYYTTYAERQGSLCSPGYCCYRCLHPHHQHNVGQTGHYNFCKANRTYCTDQTMIDAFKHRRDLYNACCARMTKDTSAMTLEVEVFAGVNERILVQITGMEDPFPVDEGVGKGRVCDKTMDERFKTVGQAIVAHQLLNAASERARIQFWGHKSKSVILSFIKEFDEKGGFLEYTQRQRWTNGGIYSICAHYLMDINLQQFNMSRWWSGRTKVLGRRWSLPDCENLRKFSMKIAESDPTSNLRQF